MHLHSFYVLLLLFFYQVKTPCVSKIIIMLSHSAALILMHMAKRPGCSDCETLTYRSHPFTFCEWPMSEVISTPRCDQTFITPSALLETMQPYWQQQKSNNPFEYQNHFQRGYIYIYIFLILQFDQKEAENLIIFILHLQQSKATCLNTSKIDWKMCTIII